MKQMLGTIINAIFRTIKTILTQNEEGVKIGFLSNNHHGMGFREF
jgi:hypothetical protein